MYSTTRAETDLHYRAYKIKARVFSQLSSDGNVTHGMPEL